MCTHNEHAQCWRQRQKCILINYNVHHFALQEAIFCSIKSPPKYICNIYHSEPCPTDTQRLFYQHLYSCSTCNTGELETCPCAKELLWQECSCPKDNVWSPQVERGKRQRWSEDESNGHQQHLRNDYTFYTAYWYKMCI